MAFLAGGTLVATGALPGSDAWAMGPRVGIATLLLVLGTTILAAGNARWFLRRTTKAEDYEGGCPVGATCSCGHFNFKPRRACKQCGAAMRYA